MESVPLFAILTDCNIDEGATSPPLGSNGATLAVRM